MKRVLKYFEHMVVAALVAMLAFVVLVSTVELGYLIVQDLLAPPVFWMEAESLLEVFGFFLLILIGVELLESIRAYMVENVVHAEIVLKVALIAVARKVIVLDVKTYSSAIMLGIAALILAIAGAFYVIKRVEMPGARQARRGHGPGESNPSESDPGGKQTHERL